MKTNKPGHFADLVAALAIKQGATADPGVVAIANANNCSTGPCGFVQDDDIALIWLQDQTQTAAVDSYLNAYAGALFIHEVMAGAEINLKFNSPLTDNATPDVLVQPIYGTIYTGSSKKNAEHGGFSFGDTNVGLIVSNPDLHSRVVKTPVATSQVAASILSRRLVPAVATLRAEEERQNLGAFLAYGLEFAGVDSKRLRPNTKGRPDPVGTPFSHF